MTCACLIQVGSLRSPRQAHARTASKRKRKIQSRAVAESPAEPLGRTSAITLGGFLDRFRFWAVCWSAAGGDRQPAYYARQSPCVIWIVNHQNLPVTKVDIPISVCYPVFVLLKLNLSFALVERKRNRRRGQGVENIAEKSESTDLDAIFSPVSLDLFGRFRLVRSRRKTNLKTDKKGKMK